ncbi:glycosyltransferase family 39 protein [Actinoplanes sp. NPDC049681]|uniref:glycosyltransferase family 39 protein n=1 Tax=Actinoplanes sp. NPDC049681 TaxID=3363905 RepID=UPI00379C570E
MALAAAPFGVTLTVTLIGIGHRELWRDEHATWWAASQPVRDLGRLTGTVDAVLYPYYLFMHGWIRLFGDAEATLRLPSAIFMALAAAVLALLGRRLFDAPTGLVAGLLLPAVPAISRYGQEARPYAMAMLASVSAVFLLLRALERPTVWRWAAYALAVVWVGYSHIVALMALAAHLVVVLPAARDRRRILAGWSAAVLAALLAVLPLVLAGQRQHAQISWIADPTWARVQGFPREMFLSGAAADLFLFLGGAALALLVVAGGREQRWIAAFLALWTLLPPALAYYTFHEFHFFLPRYLLFTVPAWVLLGAYAIRRLAGSEPKLLVAALAAGAVLAVGGWHRQAVVRSDPENEYAFRAAARFIAEREQPGDGIVFTGYPYLHRGFRYEWRHQPAARQPREVLVAQPPGTAWSWVHPPCPDTAACLGDTPRIWVVSSDPKGLPLSPLPSTQQPAVEQRYQLVSQTVFHRLWVSELVRRPAK